MVEVSEPDGRGSRVPPAPVDPLVSVVVVHRDGASRVQRLVAGLRELTDYHRIEVVLVDNGSSGSPTPSLADWSGPSQVLVQQEQVAHAAAVNQAIRASNGDLVLLAHDDIEPVDPAWLRHLVTSLTRDVAAVGAVLESGEGIHHRGQHFVPSPHGVRAVDAVADPDSATHEPEARDVAAVSAACLLARRSDLLENLLDDTYGPDVAEWDLCIRLGNTGRVVVDERAVARHHGDGSAEGALAQRPKPLKQQDRRRFNGTWGPGLLRRLRREVTAPPGDWLFRGDRTPRLGITPGRTPHATRLAELLRGQAEEAGWSVFGGTQKQSDLAIALRPPGDVQWFAQQNLSVAVVLGQEDAWVETGALDAAGAVVTPDPVVAARLRAQWAAGLPIVDTRLGDAGPGGFAALLELVRPDVDALRIGVATCAPDWTKARIWGDTHLARGLIRAFRRCGHEAVELTADDWHGAAASACDVVVHLRGLGRRPVARGQWNVLWVISHPDRLEPGECDDYDIVATASQDHAEELSRELGREVHFLPQATDADTFRVLPRSSRYEGAILYVGNARWPARRAPRWLLRHGWDFDLYGSHWEDFPEASRVRADYLPNRELPVAYRSAAVVVADHHGSMRTTGFVANRLFDVLASGGVVLSDRVAGLDDLFGDVVPTYADAGELDAGIRRLLGDPALRRRLVAEGRELVMSRHTLDHRARRILELLDAL